MEFLTILSTLSWFSLSMFFGVLGVNAPQMFRSIILLCLVTSALLAFRNVSDRNLGFEGTEPLAMFIIIYLSHMTCVLCIEKYTIPKKTAFIEWRAGYRMLFNARWLGTDRQAPDVHQNPVAELNGDVHHSHRKGVSAHPSKPIKALFHSSRAIFLRNRAVSLCIIIAMLQTYHYVSFRLLRHFGFEWEMTDFLPSKEIYFRRLTTVTFRETLVRAWIVGYWTLYSMGFYTALHDVLAFIFVSTGLDMPEDWPPLFGSIRDATSVRNFWGKFWHRLPRNSTAGKMFINFFVFAMSGAAHAITVRQLGYTCGYWEEFRFYCYSFLAILVEGFIFKAYSRITRGYKLNTTVSKVLGYMWVFTYLFATLPKNHYPKLWCIAPGGQ